MPRLIAFGRCNTGPPKTGGRSPVLASFVDLWSETWKATMKYDPPDSRIMTMRDQDRGTSCAAGFSDGGDYLADCRSRNGIEESADPSAVCETVRIIKDYGPVAVIIYGLSTADHPPGSRVKVLAIFVDGDMDSMWEDIMMALSERWIDADLTLMTPSQFVRDRELSFTDAYEANSRGYLAYESGSDRDPDGYHPGPTGFHLFPRDPS